jgi:hypothetical protein
MDPVMADILRALPSSPSELFAYMTRALAAKGVWYDKAIQDGRIRPDAGIERQRELFSTAATVLRLSRDALGSADFEAVEASLAPPGRHAVTYDADGRVVLRLVTSEPAAEEPAPAAP